MTDAKIIAIEEHFTSPHLRKLIAPREGHVQTMLDTMEGVRFTDMDEAGIDYMILSENNPATQNLAPDVAVKAAKESNDFLHEFIGRHPQRFGGFATLPTPEPKAAADELERTVTKLGFKGAMIMGTTHGRFMDGKEFRPIFERAVRLDVPVYIHPSTVKKEIIEAYFKEYPGLTGSPLGFGIETITHTFRLITSGLFDEFPTLKIVVGHLGEAAPFTLWRTQHNLAKVFRMPKGFADYYRTHFWLTTSGAFSNSALACAMAEMGVDRIMFSVDWPYINNKEGTDWLKKAPISDADRAAIFAGNAKRLLKL